MYSYVLGLTIGLLQSKYRSGKVIGYFYIGGCLYYFILQDPRRTAFSFSYPILSAFIITSLNGFMLKLGNVIYNKIENI